MTCSEDDLPEGEFDLVHARLLLAWLGEPRMGLERPIAAVKPGGWLLVEEIDFVSSVPDPRMDAEPRAPFERVVDAHNAVLAECHSFDPFYGRGVAGDLEDAGLTDTRSEGLMSSAEVDAAITLCDDPSLTTMSPLMMATWGRRPATT